MRRLVLAVLLLSAVFGTATLSAAPPAAHAQGALVLKDLFLCSLGPAGLTADSLFTITPSLNAVVVCRGQIPPALIPQAFIQRDFLCLTLIGFTTRSQIVITPGGQATLTCHVNGSS
jgi:hypothetical protein